jgi:hypothetical protein
LDEVYAPDSKHATLRALMAKVAVEDLELHQFDVKTAFFNGELEDEIYMKPPEGLQVSPGKVCRLVKSLYGLRQAPRAWHTKLKEQLSKMRFLASQPDAALFINEEKSEVVYMLVYADDILVAAKSPDVCTRPDLAQAVGAVARYLSKPTVSHWNAVHMILRYVKGTVKYGLLYTHGDLGIIGYCDAATS